MQKLAKALNVIINFIFYPILAAILVVGILFACGIKPYITMSGSMEPYIQTGSICFVNSKADYQDIAEGDVIAFETGNGSLVTHRVLSITTEGMETKGDNNEMSDGISTTAENFRGKTLFSVPYVGYILKTLQSPRNFAVIMIIAAGIFLFNVIDSYYDKKEAAEESTYEVQ